MTVRSARLWHGLTAAVAIAALLLQLALTVNGGQVLDEVEQPGLGLRLLRFFAYFTIQSNLIVAVTAVLLARDPLRDGTWWRAVRVAGIVGITVTGVVHFFLLRPLVDLDGLDRVADKMLHVAVPLLAVVGFALFGPRPRVEWRDVRLALVWPVAWTVETMVVGAITGWFPYPFLDPDEDGWLAVAVSLVGITAFFLALFAGARALDQRAAPQPQAWDPYRNR